jgi:hypothetical protein
MPPKTLKYLIDDIAVAVEEESRFLKCIEASGFLRGFRVQGCSAYDST